MPSIVAKVHDEFLKKYLETSENHIAGQERLLWVKTKSNYLYYSEINVKPVYHPLKDNIEYFGKIKRIKSVKNQAFLICNNEGVIKDISTTAINLIGIDFKTINNQQVNLSQLIPEVMDQIEEFESKVGKTIEYTFPKIQEDTILFGKGTQKVTLQVHIHQFHAKVMKEPLGQVVKLELKQVKATHKKKKQNRLNIPG